MKNNKLMLLGLVTLSLAACDVNYYTKEICTQDIRADVKGLEGKYELLVITEAVGIVTISNVGTGQYNVIMTDIKPDENGNINPVEYAINTCKVGKNQITESLFTEEDASKLYSLSIMNRKNGITILNEMEFNFDALKNLGVPYTQENNGEFSTKLTVDNSDVENPVLLNLMQVNPLGSYMLVKSTVE